MNVFSGRMGVTDRSAKTSSQKFLSVPLIQVAERLFQANVPDWALAVAIFEVMLTLYMLAAV
jgi:hypothetical protein